MCCLLATLLLVGPRAGILVWWLLDNARWVRTFDGVFIWPLLGFVFLPWTTLAYVLVAPGGISFINWIVLGLAVLVDIGSLFGGYRNRRKVPYYT